MKALEILKSTYESINYLGLGSISKEWDEQEFIELEKAIKELEELENKNCDGCKHYLSQDGNYPLEPCGECERWYSDMFEQKDKK